MIFNHNACNHFSQNPSASDTKTHQRTADQYKPKTNASSPARNIIELYETATKKHLMTHDGCSESQPIKKQVKPLNDFHIQSAALSCLSKQAFFSIEQPALNYNHLDLPSKMLEHEALCARLILNDPQSLILVKLVANQLMLLVTTMDDESFNDFTSRECQSIDEKNFPISQLIDYSDKPSYINSVKKLINAENNNYIADILSAIWRLTSFLLEDINPSMNATIGKIYKSFEVIGRSHKCLPHWNLPSSATLKAEYYLLDKGKLGAAEIDSALLDNLAPLKMLKHYFTILCDKSDMPEHSICKRNHDLGLPYLSGISGMCNCFYTIYPLLGIEFTSDMGLQLAGIMAAFMVAIGFHTFQECCNGFYITHYYKDTPQQLMKDFKSGKGPFSAESTSRSTHLLSKLFYCN